MATFPSLAPTFCVWIGNFRRPTFSVSAVGFSGSVSTFSSPAPTFYGSVGYTSSGSAALRIGDFFKLGGDIFLICADLIYLGVRCDFTCFGVDLF